MLMECSYGGPRLAVGRDAIRRVFDELVATRRKFELGDQQAAVVSGDLALTSTRSSDGTVTVEVARRQSDASGCGLSIDFPPRRSPCYGIAAFGLVSTDSNGGCDPLVATIADTLCSYESSLWPRNSLALATSVSHLPSCSGSRNLAMRS